MKLHLAFLVWLLAAAAGYAAETTVDYNRNVKPILRSQCYSCHGALKQESGLRLDSGLLIRKGGEDGPAIIPGDSAGSLLFERISDCDETSRMPPKGKPLSEKQINIVKAWIDQGARFPADEKPEVDPPKHWAFTSPVHAAVPRVATRHQSTNPIDAFIVAEHIKRGLKPRPPAEQTVLLRRVFLDLIGVPPTRQQLEAFLMAPAEDAYERVVDRLLSSPLYGERWGRHWMDVWRYSDWYGVRVANDVQYSYPQIWRWRDWIVKSLNDDKGYDRMIVEMLAADEVTPEDDETIVATGFIARSWFRGSRDTWIHDLVEHTGKAFLAITMNCAKCHDHKHDPVSQEEFFKFRAFFEPVELRQDRVPGLPDPGPFRVVNLSERFHPIKAGMIRVYDKHLNAKTYMYRLGDPRNRIPEKSPVQPGAPAFLGGKELKPERIDLPPSAYYPGLKPFIREDELAKWQSAAKSAESALIEAKRTLAAAEKRLKRSSIQQPPLRPASKLPGSQALAKTTAEVEQVRLAVRIFESQIANAKEQMASIRARSSADDAKYNKATSEVVDELSQAASQAERQAALSAARQSLARAELSLLKARHASPSEAKAKDGLKKAEAQLASAKKRVVAAEKSLKTKSTKYSLLSPSYHDWSTGRRTALARWIASPSNPLTARVAVNHIWLRHFDQPLVQSVFDFGRNGKRPTHPELLDWLAVELIDNGWSMKKLHRLIVTSSTYRRQSSIGGPDNPNLAVDPDNRFLWRMNRHRLEAEAVRDSLLFLSGQLDFRQGGPEIDNSLGQTSPRRSLYFSHHPEILMPLLELFDVANPHGCYRRTATVVPQQALCLTNSPLALNQSRLLAGRLWKDIAAQFTDPTEREEAFVKEAFNHLLSRAPAAMEQSSCEDFLHQQAAFFVKEAAKPTASEKADGYVPPADDPEMRARESLVHVLFNHHDFVSVR